MTGDADKKELPPHLQQILLLTNKKTIDLNHTPFIVSVGVENLRGLGVMDSGAGLSLASEEVIVRIQNLWPKRLVVHLCNIAL